MMFLSSHARNYKEKFNKVYCESICVRRNLFAYLHSLSLYLSLCYLRFFLYVCVCVSAFMCVYVCLCVNACMFLSVYVFPLIYTSLTAIQKWNSIYVYIFPFPSFIPQIHIIILPSYIPSIFSCLFFPIYSSSRSSITKTRDSSHDRWASVFLNPYPTFKRRLNPLPSKMPSNTVFSFTYNLLHLNRSLIEGY